jgi:hypothetical protein
LGLPQRCHHNAWQHDKTGKEEGIFAFNEMQYRSKEDDGLRSPGQKPL